MTKDPETARLIIRLDSIHNEIEQTRRDMRGINPSTSTHEKLARRCMELGIEAREIMKQRLQPTK